ncbi:MAG TPA: dihydrofolate reductase family protein, partial [Gaiellaceae bacterium]
AEELAALAQEGVQSLLFEGGPTLATAFVNADLVDKLLVFVTPHLAGAGPKLFGELTHSLRLSGVSTERIGEDVLISAYIHEP